MTCEFAREKYWSGAIWSAPDFYLKILDSAPSQLNSSGSFLP